MYQFSDLQSLLLFYLKKSQVKKIHQAYKLAERAHRGQVRSSGDPYITHPVAVAAILAELHMDDKTIMAALMHDVLEDTEVEKREIIEQFGETVANLVDGVSKLTVIEYSSRTDQQAETLRKMMLAMSEDIRVIIIKLADRLHNMRTLDALTHEKQVRKAKETLEIYAPIAKRLGMNAFRVEFEDLSFKVLQPDRYKIIQDGLKASEPERKVLVNQIILNLHQEFEKNNINVTSVTLRHKHLYSFYRKMQKRDLSLLQTVDRHIIRILTKTPNDCYLALGIIHQTYKPNFRRFKDYIAVPKSNGYQSLHTMVYGPNGVPIELQIRTENMDRIAEYGLSAHWFYKNQDNKSKNIDPEIRARKWLDNVLEIQRNTPSSREFLEHLKSDLHPEEIYLFTPNGDIFALPIGATCVDFAYAIHTDIGNHCISAKIDRRLVPLATKPISGQIVEIITSDSAHPSPTWLNFVTTGKARSSIRQWLKNQKTSEAQRFGKRLLERCLATMSLTLDDLSKQQRKNILSVLNIENFDKLYEEIGLGNYAAPLIAKRFAEAVGKQLDKEILIDIQGTEGMIISYADCCYPILGDEIIGILNSGQGIMVHRHDCSAIKKYFNEPENILYLDWSENINKDFLVKIQIDVINKRGVLAKLTGIVAELEGNIENVYVDESDFNHNSLIFMIQVKNRKHLAKIIRKIREVNFVTKVSRLR